MILTSACPQCSGHARLHDGLCPTCVMREVLGFEGELNEDIETPTADRDTSAENQTLDRLTEFLRPAQSPDELGWLGPYRVLSIIGHGGMGVVFRAEDPGLKRLVALKAILPNLADKADHRGRFWREARAAAAVRDEHVVHIYQVSEDRGIPFVAMELLEGESLDARMRREPRLSLTEILRLGRETALGLAAAHEVGLVHRDIKPGNLWLDPKNGRAKILDFGLARLSGDDAYVTRFGTIVGTPAYMAPEQARGGESDPRSDLFSLGCVLYRLCVGFNPFKGKDILAVVAALALDTPTPPCQINPDISPELSDFILCLLAKDPAKRPATALDVAKAFTRMLAARDSTSTPTTFSSPEGEQSVERAGVRVRESEGNVKIPQPRRRIGLLVGLAFAAVVGIVLGVVFFLPTANGVIRIEVKDPRIEVKLGKGHLVIKGAGVKEITITPGENWLHVERDGFGFDTKQFAVGRGENLRFLVEWQEGKIVVQKDGGFFDVAAKPITAAPTPLNLILTPDSGWVDLMPLFDLKEDVLEGSFQREGPALVNTGAYFSRLRMPLRIKGSYELRMNFIESPSSPNLLAWSLPAANLRPGLLLKHVTSIGKHFHGFAIVDQKYGDDPGVIKPNQKCNLLIRVESGKKSRLLAELDGKPFSSWEGELEPVHDQFHHDFFKEGNVDEPVYHVRKGIVRVFSMEVRVLSGEARLFRRH